MPCSSDGYPDSRDTELRRLRDVEAMLCAVMTVLPARELERIDWREAGVTKRQLDVWWNEHQRKDRLRRDREAHARAKDVAKRNALAKLTEEERKVLGL